MSEFIPGWTFGTKPVLISLDHIAILTGAVHNGTCTGFSVASQSGFLLGFVRREDMPNSLQPLAECAAAEAEKAAGPAVEPEAA